MNKNTLNLGKFALVLSLISLGGLMSSCDDDGGTTTPNARTVDRSLLTDKIWYIDGQEAHEFKSDGTYNDDETWSWFDTGDSLMINSRNLGTYTFYFDYIETNEMKGGTSIDLTRVYTTSP